ncbi:hypothetical protein JZO81_19285 [Enterococcus hulanensis]|uniref:hypothetical protein n=1 Tax=Enterococcus TaxID=1350 RepID=UPI000B5A354D|nr:MULTISPECIES: hypothetical protein [Enterococcus]MBO0413204.1 hypothetical protein [Enterococcus hulanensis]OTO15131.1 hypothetical protein A5875_004288 [Enterococcus sp. 3H8_DIV0648]
MKTGTECEYCKSDFPFDNTVLVEFDENEIEKDTGKILISNSGELLLVNRYLGQLSKINYCPMCGRKLKGVAE